MSVFAIMPVEVFMDDRLTKIHLRVLGAILSFKNRDTDLCHPRRKTISERCGYSTQTISRATTQLVELGWLKKEGLGGRSQPAKYRFTVPETLSEPDRDKKAKTVPEPDRVSNPETVSEVETVSEPETVSGPDTKTLSEPDTVNPVNGVRTRDPHRTDQLRATDQGTEKSSAREEIDPFEIFWPYCARQVSKPAARKAFKAALKKSTLDEICAGMSRWAHYWSTAGTEEQFIPHPSTWLNQERWNDSPPRTQQEKIDEQNARFTAQLEAATAGAGTEDHAALVGPDASALRKEVG